MGYVIFSWRNRYIPNLFIINLLVQKMYTFLVWDKSTGAKDVWISGSLGKSAQLTNTTIINSLAFHIG